MAEFLKGLYAVFIIGFFGLLIHGLMQYCRVDPMTGKASEDMSILGPMITWLVYIGVLVFLASIVVVVIAWAIKAIIAPLLD